MAGESLLTDMMGAGGSAASGAMTGGVPGAVVGGALGAAQVIQGIVQRNKAKKAMPGLEDPMQVSLMQQENRRAANTLTGSAYSEGNRIADQELGGGLKALARSGNVGQFGVLSRIAGDERNRALAQAQQIGLAHEQMGLGLAKSIADRKMALQMYRASQLNARGDKNISGGTQNLMAGAAQLLPKAPGILSNVAPRIVSNATPSGAPVAPTSLNIGKPELTGASPVSGMMNWGGSGGGGLTSLLTAAV